MAVQFGNLAPSAVVVAVAGYLCWSYWDDLPVGPAADTKLPVIERCLLHPELGAAAARDPFGSTVAFQLEYDESADRSPGKGKGSGGKGNPAAKPGQSGGPAGKTASANAKAAPKAAPPAKPPAPVQKISGKEATNLLAGYVLHATYIQANHRVALINGRAYSRGDAIEPADPRAAPFQLSEIHHHKVVLDYDGKKVDLAYRNTSNTQGKARGQAGGKRQPGKPQLPAGPKPVAPPARPVSANLPGLGGVS